MEIHRDEPWDNGFKVLARRDEDHSEVEVFKDWGSLKVKVRGRLEYDLEQIVMPVVQNSLSGQAQPQPRSMPSPMQSPQPGTMSQPHPMPQMQPPQVQPQQPHPTMGQMPTTMPTPIPASQPPVNLTMEHQSLANSLMQNGYQLVVNTGTQNGFFIRGKKGNVIIDIECRTSPNYQ
ncbi:hypothetical protein [Sulfuracidifex tepidarius]|uniref:Uncharacterized protein n=1 Tax=Sulfuracidifex tepidarius TaxID=1294262 RepID=A0A510E0E9_9CREN|nr:hypothetical protein [Sulfuracidifex tepidarius]BBG23223.1 hypothetical protein IC006_0507 [Sulfuracidifex tepidarius]BBG25973.1 hypothetical protein IC007_0478 [Sulfuracidifex tepidarius]